MESSHLDNRDYWYEEWQYASRDGNEKWANTCKDEYRKRVMNKLLEEPSMYYVEKLKALPTIYLN